ncbi:MAG: hypothetical protein ACQEQL_02665 [Pseudomonadota bacterium]
MSTGNTVKSLKADFLKAVYNCAIDQNTDIDQRLDALNTFRENWRLYTENDQSPAINALGEIGISDSPVKTLHKIRAVLLTDLNHRFENLAQDDSSSLTQRADQAFELMREVETLKDRFIKEWQFAYPEDVGLKEIFHYEAVSLDAFDSLNKLPQLVYDLNLKAARDIYQDMQDNPETSVLKADKEIFRHMIQAGFDDASARSLNDGQYEHNVEVYIRALDPELDWKSFCHKMSTLAIERDEIKTPTTYFGPMPNKNAGGFGSGHIESPSKNMRHYAATR